MVFCRNFDYEREVEELIDNGCNFPPSSNRQRAVLHSGRHLISSEYCPPKLRTHWRTEVFLKVDDDKCRLECHWMKGGADLM